jgi:hypothetical protein
LESPRWSWSERVEHVILGSGATRRALLAIALVAVPVLGGAIALQLVAGIPVRHLFVDTRRLGDLPIYAGAVSYLGVLAWAATASICLFAASLVGGPSGRARGFLVGAGVLSALLCVDDLWELHDRVIPSIAFRLFGILTDDAETAAELAGAAVVLAYLGLFIDSIRRTRWWLLGLAVACFGVMLAADIAWLEKPDDAIALHLLEDGVKLVGILAWLVYHADAAHQLVRGDLARRATG